jgi:hypothetical protein
LSDVIELVTDADRGLLFAHADPERGGGHCGRVYTLVHW